jgi:hypothetical protein
MATISNYRHRFSIAVFFIFIFISQSALGQIFVDDTLFVGNSDGSPFHMPYQGVADIPLWLKIIYEGSTGAISLVTPNYAVSERLDGNLYYPWQHTFYPPTWYPDYSVQVLWLTAENPPDSVGHFADYTIRMALDASYINDTLQLLSANTQFCDSTGYIVYLYEVRESQVVIDDITAVEENVPKPEEMIASRVYPNPFNFSTNIEYSLPEAGYVKIDIYDLLGRQVRTLIDEYRQAGTHTVTFNASLLSGGVYFHRLQAGEMVETKRMVFLK